MRRLQASVETDVNYFDERELALFLYPVRFKMDLMDIKYNDQNRAISPVNSNVNRADTLECDRIFALGLIGKVLSNTLKALDLITA